MERDRFLSFLSLFFGIVFSLYLVLSLHAWAGEPVNSSRVILRPPEKGKLPTTQKPRWVELNTDRPGSDYKGFWISGGCEQCQKACAKDPKCKAYTYVKPRKKGGKARCWLKYGVPKPVPNKRCISGVKSAKRPYVVKLTPKPRPFHITPLPGGDTEEPQGAVEESQGGIEESQEHTEEPYEYPEYVEEYPEQPVDKGFPEEKRGILEELGLRVGEGPEEGAQEEPVASEGMIEESAAEETPYAGGVAAALRGEKPELLITDIEMRNPSKKELIINRELRRQDWIFEINVLNIGKTPVNNVGVLVAVMDERLEAIIEDTLEYNKGFRALVYIRPSRKILSGKSVEVNAIVDPNDEYKENNEENNLFTKTFMLRRH